MEGCARPTYRHWQTKVHLPPPHTFRRFTPTITNERTNERTSCLRLASSCPAHIPTTYPSTYRTVCKTRTHRHEKWYLPLGIYSGHGTTQLPPDTRQDTILQASLNNLTEFSQFVYKKRTRDILVRTLSWNNLRCCFEAVLLAFFYCLVPFFASYHHLFQHPPPFTILPLSLAPHHPSIKISASRVPRSVRNGLWFCAERFWCRLNNSRSIEITN